MKYVIIGNSAAGIGACEGIRSLDQGGEITVISNEREHTYSRPLISYLLCGKTTREKMKYRPDSFYADHGIELCFGEVEKIDPEHKTVSLDSHQEIAYDKLLVATGSRPFVPPMDGFDSVTNKSTFMSLKDATRIEDAVTHDTRVLILGAGLIGLKCAEGIQNKVNSITIVDLADRVLPSVLTAEASSVIQKHMEKAGVAFVLGDSVARFEQSVAKLKSGKEIPFDYLVVAVGVRPNTELVNEAGGHVERGIVTNTRQETSLPDIYSAGDCAESLDITTGANRVLAILPNAYIQGECAGINMAGGNKDFANAIPMNAMGIMDLHMITAGSYDGEVISPAGKPNSNMYKRLFIKDDCLIGFIMIGDVRRAGIYTSIIKNRIPLCSLDMGLLIDSPQLIAFSKEYRKEKLGGVKNEN